MMERSQGNGNYSDPQPTGMSVLLSEDQVLALSQALSQENILAKAKEADELANQKASEDAKNQALQEGLK